MIFSEEWCPLFGIMPKIAAQDPRVVFAAQRDRE
jgi:hypothetical protein